MQLRITGATSTNWHSSKLDVLSCPVPLAAVVKRSTVHTRFDQVALVLCQCCAIYSFGKTTHGEHHICLGGLRPKKLWFHASAVPPIALIKRSMMNIIFD